MWALADDAERTRAVALLGKPTDLAATAVRQDAEVWAPWQQEIAALAAASSDEADFDQRLAEWQSRSAESEDIAASLYRATMQSDMAGQLFVRVVEAPETLPESTRALRSDEPARDDPRPSFLSLTFEEALQEFLARGIVSPDEFRKLSEDARRRAFSATLLASEGVVRRAQELIRQTLESGGTLDDFAATLRAEEVSLGITPSDPTYLENVYRTNVASAYGAGRYRQTRSPAVIAARPFVEFRATMDDRTTTICSVLNGKVFRQDDPSWAPFAPPNHFQCRSVVVARRDSRGKAVTLGSDISERPMRGFDSAPVVGMTESGEPDQTSAAAPPPSVLDTVVSKPSRPIARFTGAYEGAAPEEVDAISTGRATPKNSRFRFEPIQVHIEPDGRAFLNDGNHRLAAARLAGATQISAMVRRYDANGDYTESLEIIPIGSAGVDLSLQE